MMWSRLTRQHHRYCERRRRRGDACRGASGAHWSLFLSRSTQRWRWRLQSPPMDLVNCANPRLCSQSSCPRGSVAPVSRRGHVKGQCLTLRGGWTVPRLRPTVTLRGRFATRRRHSAYKCSTTSSITCSRGADPQAAYPCRRLDAVLPSSPQTRFSSALFPKQRGHAADEDRQAGISTSGSSAIGRVDLRRCRYPAPRGPVLRCLPRPRSNSPSRSRLQRSL